ncbi:hypothetical protein WJX84_008399 [Apatococcus fuscideae]|uniref:EamA domain-containing protein n=1 Tax=Apatococcus fuscideae TaxID=2026836 RepID=A0AAW1T870_9CHLO
MGNTGSQPQAASSREPLIAQANGAEEPLTRDPEAQAEDTAPVPGEIQQRQPSFPNAMATNLEEVAAAPGSSRSRGGRQIEAQHNGQGAGLPVKKLDKGVSHRDAPVLGLILYGTSSIFLSTMLVFAKLLGKRKFPVFEILGCRSCTIMFISLCICAWDRVNPFGNRRGLLAVRGLFGFGAIGSYFWAVQFLPLNDAMVLTYTSPIWVALLGPFLIIHEKPSKFIWIAIPLCVAGVISITQPSFLGFSKAQASLLGTFLALNQAFCSAISKMCVRELRFTDTPNVSVFYLGFCSTIGAIIGCTVPKLWGVENTFRLPNEAIEWWLILGTGLTGYGTQICMTFALKYVKAAPALAMSYLSVVWSILYGYYIFGDVPTIWSLLGAILICSTTLMLGVFERSKKAEPAAKRDAADAQEDGYTQLPSAQPGGQH